jgi:hypothetical protein
MHTQFRVSQDHKLRTMLKKQSAKVDNGVRRAVSPNLVHMHVFAYFKYIDMALVAAAHLFCLIVLIQAEEKLRIERGEATDPGADTKGSQSSHYIKLPRVTPLTSNDHFIPQHPKRSNQRTLWPLPRLHRNRPKRALQRRPKKCKTMRSSGVEFAAARVHMQRRCCDPHTLSHVCVCINFARDAAARERETSGDKTFLRTTRDKSQWFTRKTSAHHNTRGQSSCRA